MSSSNKPSVLIVDPDEEFLKAFDKENWGTVDVHTAAERKAAQLKIADRKVFFTALCVNATVCDPFAIPLVRFAKVHRPATPLYLLTEDDPAELRGGLVDELRVENLFVKPVKPKDLINNVFPYTLFEMEKIVDLARQDQTAADTTLNAEDAKMHAISAKDFLCGSKSFFDVFVRLASGKYLKLLKAGDQFDASRVKAYLQKGVTHFYMKKEAQEVYLQYCDKITEKLLAEVSVPMDIKVDQVMNFGKETMDYLQDRGFNEMTVQTAQQFVKHAGSLASQLKSGVLDSFLNQIALANHGSGTLMILSLLMESLGYKDRKTTEVIALGGLFHDIGLMKMPEKFQDEQADDWTEAELAEFHRHPIVGEQILKDIRRINPLVPQVVLQHHERRTKNGFPHQLGPGAISPVSEMIGISETFNQLIRRAAQNPQLDPVKEMERNHFDSFSFPVMEAFQKIFCRP